MFYGLISLVVFCIYMTFLFYVARQVEVGNPFYKKLSEHPIIYAAALGIYCTTWTYYGSVGGASVNGMLFLAVYVGPTIGIFLWWFLLRKLVRIKHAYRITSIADFISARYDRSRFLAAFVTIMALIGIVPYVALQIRATLTTFALITNPGGGAPSWLEYFMGWLLIAMMIIFTIIVGARKLDPSESHKGMLLSIAIQSMVQLAGLLFAGIFVTYFLFNGFGDILDRVADSSFRDNLHIGGVHAGSYLVWTTYIILGMFAVMFLPRQFHVAVIENSDEDHIRSAMWFFPLYMFLITIFVVPIAMGGLLEGLSIEYADSFVLRLLLMHGQFWLILIVFIGGISAAASMIMISSIAIATMVTNHLIFPMIEAVRQLGFLKRHLLKCRWMVIAGFILAGYMFEEQLGESYMLVNIGLISFVAVLQFAPVVIGGLYWRHGNRMGATLGLSAGFLIWFYTLFFPALIKSGWGSQQWLMPGPWGVEALQPENLFGISLSNTIVHATFWTMFFNIGFYILGSACFNASKSGQRIADEFVEILDASKKDPVNLGLSLPETVDLTQKRGVIGDLLLQFFNPDESVSILKSCLSNAGLRGKERISIVELAILQREFEKVLTGSMGISTAHKLVVGSRLFTEDESKQLSRVYAEVLADFRVPPEELVNKINFYKEHEELLSQHAAELEGKIIQLEEQIVERKRSEDALKLTQFSIDNSSINIFWVSPKGLFVYVNDQALESLGYTRDEMKTMHVWDIDPIMTKEIWPDYWNDLKKDGTSDIEMIHRRKDGSEFPVEIHSNYVKHAGAEYAFAFVRDITERKQARQELEKEKDLAEQYLNIVKVMIIGINRNKEVILVNKEGCEILGYTQEEILGKNWFDHFIPKRLKAEVSAVADKLLEGEMDLVEYYENAIVTKSGEERIIAWHNILLKDEDGEIRGLLSSGEDITRRKETEETLRRERDFNVKLVHSSPTFFVAINAEGKVIMMNPAMLEALGYSEDEVLGRDYLTGFIPHDEKDTLDEVFKTLTTSNEPTFNENRIVAKDGSEYLVEWHGRPVFNEQGKFEFFFGLGIDITERRKSEEALKRAIREKETLLNEVHHRVKNNLLTLYSLVNLQKISLRGKEEVGRALEDTKQRISAMGKVHRMLYLSKNFSEIDFSEYIKSLIDEIGITYGGESKHRVDICSDLEPVVLNIDTAIPCGLIVNELLVNSYKHAFSDKNKGNIIVSLRKIGENIELKVQDDGIGMTEDPLSGKSPTLGLRLVTMLSQQINGEITYNGEKGSLFTIVFKSVTI